MNVSEIIGDAVIASETIDVLTPVGLNASMEDPPECDVRCGVAATVIAGTFSYTVVKPACGAIELADAFTQTGVGLLCATAGVAATGALRSTADTLCDEDICGQPVFSGIPEVDVHCVASNSKQCRTVVELTRESDQRNFVSDLDVYLTYIRNSPTQGQVYSSRYHTDDSEMAADEAPPPARRLHT